MAVYTNTLNAFNALRSNSEAWRAAVARLVPGNHPPSEDLVVSLAKRIRELEQCAQSVNGAINNEELRHRELAQTNSVVFQLEQQLHERDNEINRLNALLRSVWTNNSQTQTHEIIARDREIDTLRAELTEAQTKVASLVSVSGVNLSEVQPLFSPTHLSPALERSNSHSVPPTPIYTPAQAFGTEALPVSQNTLLSSSEATEVQSMFSESFSPGFSTMSLDNNPLPLQPPMSAPATASKFAPRICHTPHASISNTEIGEASPWKSWLQLDTSTPSRVSQELGSLPY